MINKDEQGVILIGPAGGTPCAAAQAGTMPKAGATTPRAGHLSAPCRRLDCARHRGLEAISRLQYYNIPQPSAFTWQPVIPY
jgi:hypothetical protein